MVDDRRRAELAKEGRLWLLALVCAIAGAVAVYLTQSLAAGLAVFLPCVLVFGALLWWYERSRAAGDERRVRGPSGQRRR